MKKVFFSLFFIWLFLMPALADFTVDSVTFTADVQENGAAQVSTLTQLTFDTLTESLEVPLPNGTISELTAADSRVTLTETADGPVALVNPTVGFSGTTSIFMTYNLAADFETDDETGVIFTMNMLSSRWGKAIGAISFQINLPGSYTEQTEAWTMEPQIISGYYDTLDGVDCNLEVSGNSISGYVSNRMAYDSIKLQVVLPSGYFKVRQKATIASISISYTAIGMAAVLLLCFLYWFARLHTHGQTEVSQRMLAPEGLLPSQLPLALDGKTIYIPALILEWASLGYISIYRKGKKKIYLLRNMPMGSERSKPEQWLYRRIFASGKQVILKPGRFSQEAARFCSASRKRVRRVLFDPKSGNPIVVRFPAQVLTAVAIGVTVHAYLPAGQVWVLAAVAAGLAGFGYAVFLHRTLVKRASLRCKSLRELPALLPAAALIGGGLFGGTVLEAAVGLIACCFSAIATASGPRRTERGRDARAQTLGCLQFYRHVSWQRLQRFNGTEGRFYQKQLPRLVALRCDRQLAKTFDRLPCRQPEWLRGVRLQDRNAQTLQKQVSQIVRQLEKAFS